ncbi:MAG: helix-turn-helix transcriptional regulator [Elusimicrobia bacterium]|nr:helix-turn-helix transcriptional regulator [Elusimicrobiota bacterium]
MSPLFSRLIADAMARRGLGLRELCRRARLDPSFLSKVLAGKRNPPSEEDVLRRLATALEIAPVELFVAAGRIPSEWGALATNPELLRRVDAMAAGSSRRAMSSAALPVKPFSEELL